MGTEEKEPEAAAQPMLKEPGPVEKETESSMESPQTPESSDPLNTYKWQTKGAAEGEAKEADAKASPASTLEKLQKASTNKWKTMQNWRKALSEDPGDKATCGKGAEGGKDASKSHGIKKNPFKRALSEPAGVLFSTKVQSNSSAQAGPAAEGSGGSPSNDPAQKGLFKRCLKTVSQKLKKPKVQRGSSNPALLREVIEGELAHVGLTELPQPHWVPAQEVPLWDISNCELQQGQIFISQEEEPTMWTRNRVSSFMSNHSMQNLMDIDVECSPDNVIPAGTRTKGRDGVVLGKIRRKHREKAAKRNSNSQSMGLLKSNKQFGSSNSISIPVLPSLDLSTDTSTVIRPVHSSILGEKYCFEVINSENIHCFGCTSASERDRWIEELRRAAQPNKDNIERTENSLSLWVNEAKDLLPKKRYYCEVHLDGTLFARTSSRAVGKAPNRSSLAGEGAMGSTGVLNNSGGVTAGCQLFWGEFFELDNLPSISHITLHLFRDEDPKKKRSAYS